MADTLSQNEINALINSYQTNTMEDVAVATAGKQVRVYDFTRPDKFSKEHLRALNVIHSKHGALFAAALGAMIRVGTQVDLLAVDQLTYREYCASVPSGTMFVEVAMDPLSATALFEFNPAFAATCVELLTGATGVVHATTNELTEVDCAIMRPVIDIALKKYTEAWSSCISLAPRATNVMIGVGTQQVLLPAEPVLVCGYEITVGDMVSMLSICVPASAIEPILPALTLGRTLNSSNQKIEGLDVHLRHNFEAVNLRCKATLGRTSISLQDVLELQVGDVIKLANRATEPAEFWVENLPAFYGWVGTSGRNLALRIDSKISDFDF